MLRAGFVSVQLSAAVRNRSYDGGKGRIYHSALYYSGADSGAFHEEEGGTKCLGKRGDSSGRNVPALH